jgi:fumarate reductase flavoprotein subunit
MKRLSADVVIIAAGTAGLAAAVTAAEGGASVIVFEKASITGGTANRGSGLLAIQSRLQRLKQISLTREEALEIHMDFTHWRVDARLVKAYYDKSASTIDWLEKLGVEFLDVDTHSPGFNRTWHIVKAQPHGPVKAGNAATMMKILADRAKELGVQIFLKTPAKKILKEGSRIVGVVAENKSGEIFQANAKAVIIATGGFGGGMLWGIGGLVGDGIRMAREVGAEATDMVHVQSSGGGPSLVSYGLYTFAYSWLQPNLAVNLLGERFMNEEIIVCNLFTGNAITKQKNQCAFYIFDEETKNHYVKNGLDFPANAPVRPGTSLDDEIKRALDRKVPDIWVTDSIEELANKTGIDLNGLRKTLDDYNKACETGRDGIFNKNARYLRPVKQPKFYASKIIGGSIEDWGGIKTNYKTEVLTKDFEVIPGLYAAGIDAACNIYSDTYPFILPGNAMGFAINSGRIAGENAVEYIKSIGK